MGPAALEASGCRAANNLGGRMTELLQTIQTMISSETDDLAQIERTLTDGYAHALELEAEAIAARTADRSRSPRGSIAATPRRTRASSRRSRRHRRQAGALAPVARAAHRAAPLRDRVRVERSRRSVSGSATVAVAPSSCCSAALATARGSLTGHIVFTATDTPFADDVMLVRSDGTRIDLSKSRASRHRAGRFAGRQARRVLQHAWRLRSRVRRLDRRPRSAPGHAGDRGFAKRGVRSPFGSHAARSLTAPGQGTGAIHLTTVGGTSWRSDCGSRPARARSSAGRRTANRIAYTSTRPGASKVVDRRRAGSSSTSPAKPEHGLPAAGSS